MGFDNECIVNIQSLAGEYFCPVCRLLVYPNEALQSQCTHLYCKPCLTYIVATTRACPYDGYLVTEADSKPLVESNKALAETIGKITVRCLYHRSGCQWQGSLSDCTSHCSGCAFGNSPVVCNRCAVQIVHRQVQEHAQTCPGVQPQAAQPQGTQNLAATAAVGSANVEQSQTAAQSGVVAQTAQTGPALTAGHDPNLQANANAQVHGVASSVVPTPEQLYQQQYQQYYQQYPGYDPYQQAYQNYYPYPQQSQVYSQPQAQAQVQPQPQPQLPVQSQPQAPGQAQTQPLNPIPAAVNPNYQTHLAPSHPTQMMPQAHSLSHGYPQPQPRPTHPQPQQMQMPQFLQPQPQMQQNPAQMLPQTHSHSHPQQQAVFQQPPQTQYPQAQPQHQPPNQSLNATAQGQTQQSLSHGVTSHHSYSQPLAHQQMQFKAQQLPSSHPQNGPMPHLPAEIQGQLPQQHNQMGVPQAHPPLPNQQPPMQLAPQGQVSSIPPGQQRPVVPYAQQSGHPIHQHPAMPQQQMQHQQPFSGQASGPVSNQLLPRGQHVQLPPPPPFHPQGPSGMQPQQPHNYSARPVMPNQEAQSQPFAQSPAGYAGQAQGRSAQLGANQQLLGQNHQLKTNNQVQISPGQQSAQSDMNLKPLEKNLADQKNESPAQKTAEKEPSGLASECGLRAESVEAKSLKSDVDAKMGGKEDANREFRRHDKNTGSELYGLQSGLIQPASSGVKSLEAIAIEQKNGPDLSQQGKKMTMDDTSKERSGNLANDATNLGGVMSQTAPVASAHISDGTAKSEATFMGPERTIGQSHSQVLGKGTSQPGFPFPPADQGRGPHVPLHYPSPHQPPILQSALLQGPPYNAQMPGQSPNILRPQGPGHLPQPGQPHGSVPDVASGGMPGSFPPPPGRVSLYGDIQGNFGQGRAPLYSAEGHIGQQHPLNPVVNEVFFDHQSRFMDGQPPAAKSQVGSLKEAVGTDSSLTAGLRDERFKSLTDRVPRPLDKEPLGLNSDSGQKLERGAMGAHGFLPPYHPGGTNEVGDRAPVGPDGNIGRGDFAHARPDFLGPVPAVGGHHMDRFAPRSPGRENAGFPPRGYGNHPSFPRNQPGLNDFGGRLFDGGPRPLRFPSDLAGNSFPESRFPPLPGQFRRGELEGPGFMRGNEFVGEDFPSHLSRGEFQGPQNLPAHLRYGDPAGFGSFPDHARRGGPENFPPHPPFGDQFGGNMPGHPNNRSSRSNYPPAGGLDPFDPLRKRKPLSNGWCRICKVDCEGVEGLELHSQTKEHQDMAMDMVRSIKLQNAKKQKIPIERSSFEEPGKVRGSVFEVRGNGP